MKYKGYTARVVFDEPSGVLFGEVEGLRDVVTFEVTNVENLESAFRESVDDYLAMCAERGEEPEKPYSGKLLLRLDPRVHRELAMAALESGKSINAFTSDLLAIAVQREVESLINALSVQSAPNAQSSAATVQEYAMAEPPAAVTVTEPDAVSVRDYGQEAPNSNLKRTPRTPAASHTPSRSSSSRSRPSKRAA